MIPERVRGGKKMSKRKSAYLIIISLTALTIFVIGCATEEYEIELQADPEDAGEIKGEGIYEEGEEVVVEADPAEDYEFVSWQENDEKVSQSKEYEFEVENERELRAVFDKAGDTEIKAQSNPEEAGELKGEGLYQEDEDVTLKASAKEDYEFLYWEYDGMLRGREEEIEVTAREDKKLVAHFGMEAPEALMPPDFALDLYNKTASPEENTFISPVSAYLALSMLYSGAEGDTKEEISQLLHATDMSTEEFEKRCQEYREYLELGADGIVLSLADSLWIEEGTEFSSEYIETLEKYHEATAKELDFSDPDSADKINDWVSDATEEMIEEMVDEGDLAAIQYFILMNAIYFQGEWMEDFDPEETEAKEFTLDDGSTTQVNMMQRESEEYDEYRHYDGEGFEAARIPYGEEGDRTGMYIFVPDDSLADFYTRLNSENWEKWMDNFTPNYGTIGLPRFEIEYKENLSEPLKEMGMEKAFHSDADFSKMLPEKETAFLDAIEQKAIVEVDEEGTEAAAVTAAYGLGDPKPFEIIADQPFFFVVRDDKAQSILFAGALTDPS